jgi:hypothetical protein
MPPHDETFLEFARRTCALQGARRMGSTWVRTEPPGHALPDYFYGRADPTTATWPEFWAYLAAEGAPPDVVDAARRAWRAWLRYRGWAPCSRGFDPRQLDLFPRN